VFEDYLVSGGYIDLPAREAYEALDHEQRVINDDGVHIDNRIYDSPEITPSIRKASQGGGGRPERMHTFYWDRYAPDQCYWFHPEEQRWVTLRQRGLITYPYPHSDLFWRTLAKRLRDAFKGAGKSTDAGGRKEKAQNAAAATLTRRWTDRAYLSAAEARIAAADRLRNQDAQRVRLEAGAPEYKELLEGLDDETAPDGDDVTTPEEYLDQLEADSSAAEEEWAYEDEDYDLNELTGRAR
jgi:hypothetical protein